MRWPLRLRTFLLLTQIFYIELVNVPDDLELVRVGVVELGLRVRVLGLEARDVRVLLGRQKRRRCIDGVEVQ